MRYFVCSLDAIDVAVPAHWAERIIPVPQESAAFDQTASISLPALFRQRTAATPHGVLLKTPGAGRKMLLTPRIDREVEVPEEDIRRLPKVLADSLRLCSGCCFTGKGAMLILDIEAIIKETP